MDKNNNNWTGVSYTSGFFMLLGFAILGFVVSGFIGAIMLLASAGHSASALKDAMMDPKNAALLRGIQTVSVIISMFLPALLAAKILNRRPFQLLGFKKNIQWTQVGMVLAIVLVSLFIAGSLGYLNRAIPLPANWKEKFDAAERSYTDQVEMMVDLKSIGGYFLSIGILAFLPALCEESLFRGGLQNFLTRATKKPWLAILIISLVFSLVHFSFYGFLPRMFLGVMLGFIFYYTGNIWLSILAHFMNNALAVTVAYVVTNQGKSVKEAMSKDVPTFYWGFLAIPVLIVLFNLLKKTSHSLPAAAYPDQN